VTNLPQLASLLNLQPFFVSVTAGNLFTFAFGFPEYYVKRQDNRNRKDNRKDEAGERKGERRKKRRSSTPAFSLLPRFLSSPLYSSVNTGNSKRKANVANSIPIYLDLN